MGKHYNQEIELYHHEVPAALNPETGEIREIVNHFGKKRNPNMSYHNNRKVFRKTYDNAWNLLRTQTTTREFGIAQVLALKAQAFTNSLKPLGEELTVIEIAEELGENRNTIMKVINKFFELGVIGMFSVSSKDKKVIRYWVFNPYLTFNGKIVEKGLSELFAETVYANV